MEVLLYCGKTRDLTIKFGPGDTRYRSIFGRTADIEAIDANCGLHAFSDSSWGVPVTYWRKILLLPSWTVLHALTDAPARRHGAAPL